MTEIDGPRADVDDRYILSYYADDLSDDINQGRLMSVVAPEGIYLQSNIKYTATGKILSYESDNNLYVEYSYYPGNDRLETLSKTDLTTGEARKTHWEYLETGEVSSITQGYASPDETIISFEYDQARRLTRIYDGLGNYIEYSLDTEGNVLSEKIFDADGYLKKAINQTFDAYNRLDLSAQMNESRDQDFADNGTLSSETDGKGVITHYDYDALRRLSSITHDVGGSSPSSANALTQFGYDIQDNLVSVTDPNGGETGYVYDDLGNLLSQESPDTGVTTFTYDVAGNVVSKTDAKGQATTYSYDAMNRVVSAIASGSAEDNVSYEYDSCTGGAGRLCKLVRGVSELVYAYTAFGDIRSITQTIDTYPGFQQAISTLAYTYDTAGRQQDLTYPSGNKVTYTYDAAGNIYSVILNDGEANLITEARYLPFAGVTSEKRGNGTVVATSYDQAYRQQLRYGGGFYEYQVFDQLGNTLNQYVPGTASSFEYDALGRLEGAAGSFGTKEYGYDKNANRTSLVHDGVTSSNSYEANSNRMDMLAGESVILDANGNTVSMRDMQMQYTHDNRLKSIIGNSVYEYNGRGQRVMKSFNARGKAASYHLINTVFMYYQ